MVQTSSHRESSPDRSATPVRIAWIAIEPTPYDMPLYETLNRLDPIDLELLCVIPHSRFDWMRDEDLAFVSKASRGWRFRLGRDILKTLNLGVLWAIWTGRWDCVVVPGYSNPTALAAIVLCILSRIRFIVRADTTLLKRRSPWRTLGKRSLVYPLVRRCAAAMGISSEAMKYFESIGIPAERIFLVPCVSHLDDYRRTIAEQEVSRGATRSQLDTPQDACVGIFVGRFVHVKGLDLLLEGLKDLPSSKRPVLWLVGDGPERERLETYAQAHALPVRFAGFVQNRDVPRYLRSADFFVLPARSEPWGIVVSEAMVCGLPVVLSRGVGAAYDLLREGENGFWISGGRNGGCKSALDRCVAWRDRLPAMGKEAERTVGPWGRTMAVEGCLAGLGAATERKLDKHTSEIDIR